MQKVTLVVLAAGIGSRYGGIKQLDGFGPNGERIIDYTVYDAIQAGFGKIVFVIRKEIEADFKEAIYHKWKDQIPTELVYQELDSLPASYQVPEGRTKPWGTAHAVWMAESVVNEPFAIVNADDFYGRNSLKAAADFLKTVKEGEKAACLVAYELNKTLSDSGSVSRGICEADKNGILKSITERTSILKKGDGIVFQEDGKDHLLHPEMPVSMNLMGFSPLVFEQIQKGFDEVYQKSKENLKVEYYIPAVLNAWIQQGLSVPMLQTEDQWFGVTYPEDKPWVREQLLRLHEQGVYPKNLWG